MKGLMSFVVRLIHAAGIALLLIVILVCCLTLMYFWQWNQKMPTATTLAGLSRSQTPMVLLLSVEANEGLFYLWISTPVNFFGMPSEPTVYAFNSHGDLLDWGLEAEEIYSISYYYGQRSLGIPIHIEEAIKRINNQKPFSSE